MMKKFVEEYGVLQQKYGLPLIDSLNDEFEIVDIVYEKKVFPSFPLRYVRRIMVNNFYGWINYLHNFIMPNQQSAILIRESECLSSEQKKKVTDIIKEIMFINRLSAMLDLEGSEVKDGDFIKVYYVKWLQIKKMILKLAEINVESWKKDMSSDRESYFG